MTRMGSKWNEASELCSQELGRPLPNGCEAEPGDILVVERTRPRSEAQTGTAPGPQVAPEPEENVDDPRAFSLGTTPDWVNTAGDVAGKAVVGTAAALGLANGASNLRTTSD